MFFWPQTVENRAALRTATASIFAILLSFKLHLETPFWSGMTVVVVSNLYTGTIIDKAMLRIIGTIAGAFLGFFVAGLVTNSLLLYILSCFFIVCVGAYYYSFSINGYAYLLGALCAFIVISQLALNPQNAFFVAIWRPVEIGIGVVVAAISAYFIFPNHLKDNLAIQIHDIFADLADELTQLINVLCEDSPDFSILVQGNLKLKKKLRKIVELIGALNHELGVTKERVDEIRALLNIFYDLSRQLHYLLLISSQHSTLNTIRLLSLTALSSAIKKDITQLQLAFAKQVELPLQLNISVAIEALENEYKQKHKLTTGSSTRLEMGNSLTKTPMIQTDFIHALLHFLHQLNRSFLMLQSLFANIPTGMCTNYQIINTQDRLRTDIDVIKRSIKSGFSVILALVLWMMTNWPGGLNGIISSLVISIRKNLFEMKHISVHRLLGCIFGGGVALASLYMLKMTLFDCIWILFFSIWGFSYFMFKSPQYSYIGLQANIALIITLAQEGGPPVSLGPPLERLGGIVIGVFASFIVANFIWRSDIWTMLDRHLNKLYLFVIQNIKQVLLETEKQKILHDLANLFWSSRGLLESLTNESLTFKKQIKLKELRERFDSLVMIQATISHILIAVDKEKIIKTAHLLGCDLDFYDKEVISSFEHHDAAKGLKLRQKIQLVIADLDNNAMLSHVSYEDLRGFLAYMNALNQLTLNIQ